MKAKQITLLLLVIGMLSCEEFVEIDPPVTSLVSETVFESDATAEAAARGMYSQLTQIISFLNGTSSLSWYGGLSSDELLNFNTDNDQIELFENDLRPENNKVNGVWIRAYETLYLANSIIAGVTNSTNLSQAIGDRLTGEAKFVRAFCYFYLVNLFGDVPLATGISVEENGSLERSAVADVYDLILHDLSDAKELLPLEYVGEERVRPNSYTASALLARTHLYLEDWANAETQASEIIDSPVYSLEDDLNNVFLTVSSEAIWQLRSTEELFNTWDGFYFILNGPPTNVALNSELVESFDIGDKRSANWIGSLATGSETFFYPFKYKVRLDFSGSPTEHLMVLRLAEQYLIRSEARARQNNIAGAQEDLNTIRNRAGLSNILVPDQVLLLSAIAEERRHELFTEHGHRWFDLKRTGQSTAVLGSVKPLWNETDVLFPVPQSEIIRNPNLTQNEGY